VVSTIASIISIHYQKSIRNSNEYCHKFESATQFWLKGAKFRYLSHIQNNPNDKAIGDPVDTILDSDLSALTGRITDIAYNQGDVPVTFDTFDLQGFDKNQWIGTQAALELEDLHCSNYCYARNAKKVIEKLEDSQFESIPDDIQNQYLLRTLENGEVFTYEQKSM